MSKKKTKRRRAAKTIKQVSDEFVVEKKELMALQKKRIELADLETTEIREAGGFRKAGVFIKGLARRASLNKEINQRRQLLRGQQQIKRLKQQKEIAQIKRQIAAEKPKPLSLEDLNKPIEHFKAEDVFKPL